MVAASKTVALAHAVPMIVAQAMNSSSLENCAQPILDTNDGRTNFNSTGSTSFRLTPDQESDWYLPYGLTDFRGENVNFGPWVTMQDLSVYSSVPESLIGTELGNNTNFCMYMMPGQNETLTYSNDDASMSCERVLNEDCLRALRST